MADAAEDKISVLFVCLGNICRSPMAHAVFQNHISQLPPNLRLRFGTIDSAGTGAYHTLEPPDYRTMETLEKHGISNFDHGARKVHKQDFSEFDYIMAMGGMNLANLQNSHSRSGGTRATVSLFGKYGGRQRSGKTRSRRDRVERDAGEGEEVIDPYYGGDEGFEEVHEQVDRFSKAFLREVLGEDYEEKKK